MTSVSPSAIALNTGCQEVQRPGASTGGLMGDLDSLLARLDPDPRARGDAFEELCAWWLRTDPIYSGKLRSVWRWAEWPGRDGPDTGIDLVAETVDGDIWAIQCKAYSSEYSVTKRDVDTFLADSSRRPFDYRLLIASTDAVGANADRTLSRQDTPVGLVLRHDLACSHVRWPDSPCELTAGSRLPPVEPRPHQLAALDAVVSGLAINARGQLVMACGTGKTLVGLWTHERLQSQATLVLLPSLSLLSQALREWSAHAQDGFASLAVCSDDSVTDQVVAKTSALGVPTSTDPEVICEFLGHAVGPRVIFATYQSSGAVAEAVLRTGTRLDLLVADEAHRTTGRRSGPFAVALNDERLPVHRRLFMTATPRFFTKRVRDEATADGFQVASMTDTATYGPVLHRLGFAQAVEERLLADYRVVVLGVGSSEYRKWIEDRRLLSIDGRDVTDARTLAGQVGLGRAMRDYDLRSVITFHNRVAAARRFAEELPDVLEWMPADVRPSGSTWTGHISGTMPVGTRLTQLRQLASPHGAGRAVLSNAQCLSEGVDVPALDGVAFIEPRRSAIDIIQAVGRVMRLAPDKNLGTIVLPVLVDDETVIDEIVSASAWEPVWALVRALRAHDDDLAAELDGLRRELGRSGTAASTKLPAKIRIDLPTDAPTDFARAVVIHIVEETTPSFHSWLGMLDSYIEKHSSAQVPVHYQTPDGQRLGAWVNHQRTLYRQGRLPEDRIQLLASLPHWAWSIPDAKWEEGLEHLRRYAAAHGHTRVPQRYVTEDGYALGQWVATTRRHYTRGGLAPDRVACLEALPKWAWNTTEQAWFEMFDALQRFAADSGHIDIPNDLTAHGRDLKPWIRRQKTAHRRGTLDADRVQLLDQLPGWSWGASNENSTGLDRHRWEDNYLLLKDYVREYGHARPSMKEEYWGRSLGAWVVAQRQNYRHGLLPTEAAAKLESLPGWAWNIADARWEAGFALLEEFARQHGHCVVPPGYRREGLDLREWASSQRAKEKQGRLADKHRERLNSLPGWWWRGEYGRGTPVRPVP